MRLSKQPPCKVHGILTQAATVHGPLLSSHAMPPSKNRHIKQSHTFGPKTTRRARSSCTQTDLGARWCDGSSASKSQTDRLHHCLRNHRGLLSSDEEGKVEKGKRKEGETREREKEREREREKERGSEKCGHQLIRARDVKMI